MAKDKSKQKSTELAPAWPFNWTSLDRAFDNFRREFERTFPTFPSLPKGTTSMSCDVADEGDEYTIKVEMPGVKKNEIRLNVFDNSLEVSAEHKEEEEEKKKNYLRKERSEISYYRTIPLPEKVKTDKTQAKLTDGILNITIPKVMPTPKPKGSSVQVQ
ncbi:MAG TPA: Hsp20/alpha crystallin family protein [Candidatus Nitrosotenuis sp.]|nr:Hsp20/alpha crystallin family protein [Candidatus Nitrosotenuis sp.]